MSWSAPKGAVYLSASDRRALRSMLADLQNHRLEVTLAPSKHEEIAERGGMIRVVMDRNAPWYQRMCADFPSSRKRDKRAPDTLIKREHTITALESMIRTGMVKGANQQRILAYIPGFQKDQEAERAYQRKQMAVIKNERRKQRRAEMRKKKYDPDNEIPF